MTGGAAEVPQGSFEHPPSWLCAESLRPGALSPDLTEGNRLERSIAGTRPRVEGSSEWISASPKRRGGLTGERLFVHIVTICNATEPLTGDSMSKCIECKGHATGIASWASRARSRRYLPVAGTVLLMALNAACSPVPLSAAARQVRIVTAEPSGCKYLGEVTGNQGNSFTGGFTSNADLETGARNDMKNQAAQVGANTVQLLTTRAGQTGNFGVSQGSGGGSIEETNVTYVGVAYSCPGR